MISRFAALVVILSVTFTLEGCIAIPHPVPPEELPFNEKRIAFIEPGVTPRREVEQEFGFGEPAVDFSSKRIVVYGAARTVGNLPWSVGLYVEFAGGNIPIQTKHLLIVQYTVEDLVESAHVIRNDEGCTPDGICAKADFFIDRNSGWSNTESGIMSIILFARATDDEVAKTFRVYPEKCSIYIYKTGAKGRLWVYMYKTGEKGRLWLYPSGEKIIITSQFDGETLPIDKESYLHWVVEPGPVTFFTNIEVGVEFDLDCKPGEIHFLNIAYSEKKGTDTVNFSIDGAKYGKQLVGDRRLTLNRWIGEDPEG